MPGFEDMHGRVWGADADVVEQEVAVATPMGVAALRAEEARELAAALFAAAMEADEDTESEADPASILRGVVAELREHDEDAPWVDPVLNDAVAAYERLTGSTP
jgi:hypothetical protein